MAPRTTVLIGRFQPPHLAHLALMQAALEWGSELVIVLGSARSARTVRNPLNDAERATLILAMLEAQGIDLERVRTETVPDAYYNLPMWVRRVREAVHSEHAVLAGFEKDASSFYLRLFPEWQVSPPDFVSDLNATDLREAMYRGDWAAVGQGVTPEVLAGLQDFARTPAFAELQADRDAVLTLAAGGPIRTVGTLLVAEGMMLVQVRPERPGAGLWAIPEASSAPEAMRQVLSDPPGAVQVRERCLDNPQRLPGVDWITQAGVYRIPEVLPPLPGAEWIPLEAVTTQPERFFADHAQGIRSLLEDWPRTRPFS